MSLFDVYFYNYKPIVLKRLEKESVRARGKKKK